MVTGIGVLSLRLKSGARCFLYIQEASSSLEPQPSGHQFRERNSKVHGSPPSPGSPWVGGLQLMASLPEHSPTQFFFLTRYPQPPDIPVATLAMHVLSSRLLH